MTSQSAQPSRVISRDTLVLVAAALFARRGYRATTLDHVAAELGVKKGSLYHYIDSKDDLLLDIYRSIFDRVYNTVAPLAALDLPPDERLRRMVHAHLSVVIDEHDMLAVAFREEAELPLEAQRHIRRRKRQHESLFETVLEEGQREGLIRPGSARLMVLALLGMCNWLYQWYQPERQSPEVVAAEFTTLLESGWLAGDETSSGWPRYTSVGEAMGPIQAALDRTRGDLERLEHEIAQADIRLRSGLVGPRSERRLRPVKWVTDKE